MAKPGNRLKVLLTAARKKRKERISNGLFRCFFERQPQPRLCKRDCTAFVRLSAMSNNEALDSYYRELKSILDGYNLYGKPEKFIM